MSLIKTNKIAGLIMAAGGSSRLNTPKQLLDWKGDYLINHILKIVSSSDIGEIIIVLGSHKGLIEPKINTGNARIIENPKWESGLSSSIKCGIAALSEDIDGAFIVLLDQPFITTSLLNEMMDIFNQSGAQIVAPRVNQQQANPVLFSRDVFPELLQIKGDKGAKGLLKKYDQKWLDWHDTNLLMDIDSEKDYKKAIKMSDSQSLDSSS